MRPFEHHQVRPEAENNIKQWHAKTSSATPSQAKSYPMKPSLCSKLKQRTKFSVVGFKLI